MHLVSPFAASQVIIWDLHESYHMLISPSIFGNWSWQVPLEKSSLLLWAPLSSAMRTVSLQFPSFPQHWCSQACRQAFWAVVCAAVWQRMHSLASWLKARRGFPRSASWNCMAEWWKVAMALLWITPHSLSGGTTAREGLKNGLFPSSCFLPSCSKAFPRPP